MAMAAPITPHRVAVLALEPVVGFDLTIPPTVLGEATTPEGTRLYDVKICGLDSTPIHAGAGFSLIPDHGVEALAEADTVIIPGTYIHQPRHEGTLPDDLAAALATIRPGTRIASICTGAFVLGAAGLLDGRPATTHWRRADAFRALYPKVLLDEDLLFVGWTCACTSSGATSGVRSPTARPGTASWRLGVTAANHSSSNA
jgi:transcriptional regulator GlxA family with amidase domain